jgi:hypothetical protein
MCGRQNICGPLEPKSSLSTRVFAFAFPLVVPPTRTERTLCGPFRIDRFGSEIALTSSIIVVPAAQSSRDNRSASSRNPSKKPPAGKDYCW